MAIISAERFFALLPRIASCFKGFIVDPTASVKHLLKRRLLCFCRTQSVPECLTHAVIIPQILHNGKCCAVAYTIEFAKGLSRDSQNIGFSERCGGLRIRQHRKSKGRYHAQ